MTIKFFHLKAKFFFSLLLMGTTVKADNTPCKARLRQEVKDHFRSASLPDSDLKKKCPLVSKIIAWGVLSKKGTFTEIQHFLTTHPHWPQEETLRCQGEKHLFKDFQSQGRLPFPAKDIRQWFRKYPPLTPQGLYVFGKSLEGKKNSQDLEAYQKSFMNISSGGQEVLLLLKDQGALLPSALIYEKSCRYLEKSDTSSAQLLSPFLSPSHRQQLHKRLKLQGSSLESSFPTPQNPSQNLDLAYEFVRLYRKAKDNHAAAQLLRQTQWSEAGGLVSPEALWIERNLIARRFLEEKDYKNAYEVLKNHGLTMGENFAHGEFMLGWIALRFLNSPHQALIHFRRLHEGVKAPISVARAAFWMGKTYETLGNKSQAHAWYKKAIAHDSTYYGQLAYKAMHGYPLKATPKSFAKCPKIRQRLLRVPLIQAMGLFGELGLLSYGEMFAHAAAKRLVSPEEKKGFIALVHETLSPAEALEVYKRSLKHSGPLLPHVYPQLPYIPPKTISAAFAHAIIRQESRFKPYIKSHAGAAGLMQLMPATAAKVVKTHKLKEKPLTDPKHNVMLGCLHLQELLTKYKGSMILAAAAYNAGAKAVDDWIEQFGDPRAPGVDVVDWVEHIPYAETRNYVQRVMENYAVYQGISLN